jgi:MYXO-CTERM domain-containing protein
LSWSGRAAAFGGVTTATGDGVVASAQRVVMSITSHGMTEIILELTVPVTSTDYVALIPTPSEPILDPLPSSSAVADVDDLDWETVPIINARSYAEGGDGTFGCACEPAKNSSGPSISNNEISEGVSVWPPLSLGSATAFSAPDVAALNQWLSANNFVLPAERKDLAERYVGPGRYFIALKLDDPSVIGTLTTIGWHYTLQGDVRELPLGFARLGAAPVVAFTVFLFASSPTIPTAPFATLTLDDLDPNLLSTYQYRPAVEQAVKAAGGHAFVLEGGFNESELRTKLLLKNNLVGIVDDDAKFVRMSSVVAADDIDQDVTLTTPAPWPIENERVIGPEGPPPASASVGLLGLLALGLGARRRRRP